MPLMTYPLNNIDYVAEDAGLFHCTRTSGVYAGDDFSRILTGTDNTITLSVGLAWLRISRFFGVVCAMKEELSLDLGIPDTTYPRIDTIVLQYDANKNGTDVVVKQGVPASSPQPPVRSTTEALYELHLYHVRREPGASSITAANVTDLRLNEKYCGLMADSVTRVDTAAINTQIMALIGQLQEELTAVRAGTAFVLKSGDRMTGNLEVPTPTESGHAANKGYVDTREIHVVLSASGWSDAAPYEQSVQVNDLTDARRVAVYPLWPEDPDEEAALQEETAKVSSCRRSGSTVTFRCLEDKPVLDIPVVVEVSV